MGALAVSVSTGTLLGAWLANGWSLGHLDGLLLVALAAAVAVGALAYRSADARGRQPPGGADRS